MERGSQLDKAVGVFPSIENLPNTITRIYTY